MELKQCYLDDACFRMFSIQNKWNHNQKILGKFLKIVIFCRGLPLVFITGLHLVFYYTV